MGCRLMRLLVLKVALLLPPAWIFGYPTSIIESLVVIMNNGMHDNDNIEGIDGSRFTMRTERRPAREMNFLYRQDTLRPRDIIEIEEMRRQEDDMLNYYAELVGAAAAMAAIWHHEIMENNEATTRQAYSIYESAVAELEQVEDAIQNIWERIEAKMYSDRIKSILPPERNRSIDDMDDTSIYFATGLSRDDFVKVKQHWRIPDEFSYAASTNNRKISGDAVILIYLHHMRHGETYLSMSRSFFGGDPRLFTYIIRAVVGHLHDTFYHKIAGRSLEMYVERFDQYRQVLWQCFSDETFKDKDVRIGVKD